MLKALRRGSSLFRYQFAIVRDVRLGLLKSFALSKLDSKTFPSYSSSALYVSVPGYYFSTILIDFLKIIQRTKIYFYFKDQWLELLTKSYTFKANMYIFSYTVFVNVKQLYRSYDLFINK